MNKEVKAKLSVVGSLSPPCELWRSNLNQRLVANPFMLLFPLLFSYSFHFFPSRKKQFFEKGNVNWKEKSKLRKIMIASIVVDRHGRLVHMNVCMCACLFVENQTHTFLTTNRVWLRHCLFHLPTSLQCLK